MAYKDKKQMYDYNNNFQRQTYDRIQVLPKKEEGQRIREAAAAAGQSVSEFILDAVRDRLKECP